MRIFAVRFLSLLASGTVMGMVPQAFAQVADVTTADVAAGAPPAVATPDTASGAPAAAVPQPVPQAPAIEPLPASFSEPLYKLLKNEHYKAQMGSVFFSAEQQSMLDRIFRMIAEGKQEEAIAMIGGAQQDPMDVLMGGVTPAPTEPGQPQKPPEIPPDIPVFYLSSIMYVSPNEWALWLNGKRFTASRPATTDGKIEVLGVSPTEASFSWLPYRYAQISVMVNADLQSQVVQEKELSPDMEIITPKTNSLVPRKSNAVATAGRLGVDDALRRVHFTLRTNQSFYTLPPRIGEGLPFRDSVGNAALPGTTQLAPTGQPPLVRQLVPAASGVATPPAVLTPAEQVPPASNTLPPSGDAPAAPKTPGENYREVDGLIQRM